MSGQAEGLSTRLGKASRKIHTLSNSLVNFKLVALFTDRVLYAKAIAMFYHVFVALEAELAKALERKDPDVSALNEPLTEGLLRARGFREDLEYYLGEDWEAQCGPKSTPLKEYEHHLSVLGSTQPRLLLAHSYTQHLAIAFGGQIVGRLARKHFSLPEDQGTASFDFKMQGDSNNTLRHKYKTQLDKWGRGLSEEEVQQLIEEHLAAFQYNNAMMRDFPIPVSATMRGAMRVTPRPVMLVLLAVLVLLLALVVPCLARLLRPA